FTTWHQSLLEFFQSLVSVDGSLKVSSFNLCLSNSMSSPTPIALTKFNLLLTHLTWMKPLASLNHVFLSLKITGFYF
ncbi:hypothetical protein VIGAN_04273700, partial [Vigna angularis var. angularis]